MVLFEYKDDLILLAVSSRSSENEVSIKVDSLVDSKLPVDSYVKLHKCATLHKSIVKKNIGSLKQKVFESIVQKFVSQLAQ